MANPNKAPRDPITDLQDEKGGEYTGGGKVKNASAGRIRSISGGGPNFTSGGPEGSKGTTGKGWPVPNSPYGK
jgi:hypothetical protein